MVNDSLWGPAIYSTAVTLRAFRLVFVVVITCERYTLVPGRQRAPWGLAWSESSARSDNAFGGRQYTTSPAPSKVRACSHFPPTDPWPTTTIAATDDLPRRPIPTTLRKHRSPPRPPFPAPPCNCRCSLTQRRRSMTTMGMMSANMSTRMTTRVPALPANNLDLLNNHSTTNTPSSPSPSPSSSNHHNRPPQHLRPL